MIEEKRVSFAKIIVGLGQSVSKHKKSIVKFSIK